MGMSGTIASESGELPLELRVIDDFRINKVVRNLAACRAEHAQRGGFSGSTPDIRRRRAPMGRQDHVVQFQQRVVGRQGFELENIQCRASDPPVS